MSRKIKKQKCNKYRNSKKERHLTVVNHIEKGPIVVPRGFTQNKLIGFLIDKSVDIVFVTGPAGTGKTLLSTLIGIQEMQQGHYQKYVVTRPAISVEEDHGALPGTLIEKLSPWTRPVIDIFRKYYTQSQMEWMLESETLELAPLGYMRGRNFEDCWIIADECQNATISQMKMLLTRVGKRSKLIITGDPTQHDRGYEKNGLHDFLKRMDGMQSDRIKIIRFSVQDIERHPVVEEILKLYEK